MTTSAEFVTERARSIVMADDDADDRMFAEDAFKKAQFEIEIRFVNDGVELLEFLTRSGNYVQLERDPLPSLILLDLKMPRMDGYEALRRIKNDPGLQRIPVVVMTTSNSESDIALTYDLGVNSFIVKPSSFKDLVAVMSDLNRYWFERVELPPSPPLFCGDQGA